MEQQQFAKRHAVSSEYTPIWRLLRNRASTISRNIAKAGPHKDSREDIHALLSVLKQSLTLR